MYLLPSLAFGIAIHLTATLAIEPRQGDNGKTVSSIFNAISATGASAGELSQVLTEINNGPATNYGYGYYNPTAATAAVTATGTVDESGAAFTSAEAYLATVCYPVDNSGDPVSGYPCNTVNELQSTCITNGSDSASANSQQKCFCSGGKGAALWENFNGCADCVRLHGGVEGSDYLPTQYLDAVSSTYCGQKTASLGLINFIHQNTALLSLATGATAKASDALSGKTDVSLYFTPSATFSAASKTAAAKGSITPEPSQGGNAGSTGGKARPTTTKPAPSSSTSGLGTACQVQLSDLIGDANTRSLIPPPPLPPFMSIEISKHPFTILPSRLFGSPPQRLLHHHKPSLLPLGSKAYPVTTSYPKKRKLSPADITTISLAPRSSSVSDGTSSPASQQTQPLSSPIQAPQTNLPSNLVAPPSPPRAIPPHLTIEGARTGRSPTPELTSTAASSPSAAYAGLSLEADGSGDRAKNEGLTVKQLQNSVPVGERQLGRLPVQRSSSPGVKRSATDMEDHDALDGSVEPMKDVISTSPQAEKHPIAGLPKDISVNTTGLSNGSSADDGHSTFGAKDNADGPFHGAYQTPKSGTSSTTSTNGIQESSASSLTAETPPIDEQIAKVMQLVHEQDFDGKKGYLVSTKWLSRVLARSSETERAKKIGKEATEGPIGPVDNSNLNLVMDATFGDIKDEAGEPFFPLRPGLVMEEDYHVLPQRAWDLIVSWYGIAPGSPVITRYCHNTMENGDIPNLQYELHPPIFTLLKLPDTSGGMTSKTLREKDASPIKTLASRHESFQKFLKRAKALVGVDMTTKVRIWKILSGLHGGGGQSGMMTPAQSRSASPAPNAVLPVDPGDRLILDVKTFADLELGTQREYLEGVSDQTSNEKYNGRMSLSIAGLSRDEVIVLEEQIGGPAGGEWVSDAVSRQSKANGVPISVTKSGITVAQDSLKPKGKSASGRTSPAPGGMMTRGRQKTGRTPGLTGLGNLGNTCYMNSALQCLKNVEELTQYFLQGRYKGELNPSNPLSHFGEVAKAYAGLLNEMYGSNSASSFSPRGFRNVIGRYGPSFSGYGQQDSQEFLLFLLDGLQEDLNRIKNKPYKEKPDSTDEMVHDNAALMRMADECWDIYKARNDSVVTDLFAGMYKSTVVCPVCDKVSIIFDPFNNLTLQLPIENVWSRSIYFYPLHDRPILVSVDIDKNATFGDLKEYIAKKVNIDPKKSILAEVYRSRLYKMFDDKNSIGDERIAETDTVVLFELEDVPSNYPPPKKKTAKIGFNKYSRSEVDEDMSEDSPFADKMLVAIYNRTISTKTSSYQQESRNLFAIPSFIVLNREEAKDYDVILKKVLAKVETMTTRDFLREFDDSTNEDQVTSEDSDTVLMHTDEADSASSNVQARSLDEEDDMVDISMREGRAEAAATPHVSQQPPILRPKPPASMLEPGAYIAPQVRSLFDMKYFRSGSEMVPLGWSALQDENRDYPTIASRRSAPVQETIESHPLEAYRRDLESLTRDIQDPISSSEEDVEDAAEEIPSLVEGSGSESDGLPTVEKLIAQPPHTPHTDVARNSRKMVTYSRKDRNHEGTAMHEEDMNPPDDVPLLQLGEAIVLDWNIDAHDALFNGVEADEQEMRGAGTWEVVLTLPDPELEQRRRLRTSRKKNGVSLGDCLDEFGKAETLSENDAWYCPRCKEHRRASKQFELWKAPDVLVIHLKRFSAHGRFRDKLDVKVDFPIEGLDLSTRVAMHDEGKSMVYDLFAVDNHYGGLTGGHYTAFAQNFIDKNWYEYNDSVVTARKNPENVVTSAAYLLFYRRRTEGTLGGPFFEQIVNAAHNPAAESKSNSRAGSPAGEGRRLDGSSRNGSSSASQGAEAAHQAGGGGAAIGTVMKTMEPDEELPGYTDDKQTTLEGMDMDDEGIGGMHGPYPRTSIVDDPQWSFAHLGSSGGPNVSQMSALPPGDEEDEDLFDGESTKMNSSPSIDGRESMFTDDVGTTHGFLGSPSGQPGTPIEGITPLLADEDDDAPAAEIRLSGSEGEDGVDGVKMD